MNFYQELKARGLVEETSSEDLPELLNQKKISFYIGFDPSAKSLQIGNLFALITMKRFQLFGHRPYVVIGGATGMIGDPSGKSSERILLSDQVIDINIKAQEKQFKKILDFNEGPNNAMMLNNYDWISKFSFIDFLRDIGKRFRVTEMLAKESVKNRIESEAGISFTEFSYQILQAYDFRFLAKEHDVILQVGGRDQWGNITAGIDLARKMDGRQVYGMVTPLVVDANGNKFGKSEGGATIYLDPEMTSPYQMYQYLINCDDLSVIKYLKYFTFLSLEEIAILEEKTKTEPHLREAQKKLASCLLEIVHGEKALADAIHATKIFFGETINNLKDNDLHDIFKDVPSLSLELNSLKTGIPIIELLAQTPLFSSKAEVKRSLEQKGVYLNNNNVQDMSYIINEKNLASETCLVIRKGKKNYCLVKFS